MSEQQTAVDTWFRAHRAYHEASAAYNARLTLVRSERERGNWSINTNPEYQSLAEAQREALQADEILYRALVAQTVEQ
jgi:hypothetical protein